MSSFHLSGHRTRSCMRDTLSEGSLLVGLNQFPTPRRPEVELHYVFSIVNLASKLETDASVEALGASFPLTTDR